MWAWLIDRLGLATKADLEKQEKKMNAAIAGFQQRMTAGFAAANEKLSQIEGDEAGDKAKIAALQTEEDALKQQIADLQAKQAAGTFGEDDAAALADVESKYAALVARITADAPAADAPTA